MTGQDAILDAAALEREAHVRAAIVEGKDAPAVVDHQDRAVGAVYNEPALGPEFFKAPREREFRCRRVHERRSVCGPQVLVIATFVQTFPDGMYRGTEPPQRLFEEDGSDRDVEDRRTTSSAHTTRSRPRENLIAVLASA